jgi:tetratricopeptide (TPR) repeat protein
MSDDRSPSAGDTTAGGPSPDALDASVRLARVRRRLFAAVEAPTIAQYQVLRSIGGGANGLVFAAWDPSLDRVVALKVLRDPWSPRASAKLRAEAVALAKLRHPGVVSVFEVGEHEGQCFLAMEYVEGETGRAWMHAWRGRRPRDLGRLLDVIEQVGRALAAAHASGLVHRDVKPENVMIDVDGRARLMDFGLARADQTARTLADDDAMASASSHAPYGTPGYMAPEQLRGDEVGPAADQFALAAWLFEGLYERRIRPDRSPTGAAHLTVEVPSDRAVPRALQRILARALADDPRDRWPSTAAFVDAMAAARSRPRRIGAFAAMSALAAGVTAGAMLVAPTDERCTGAADRLAGVWDDEVALRLREAVGRGDPAFADAVVPVTWPELDRYRDAWIDAHRSSCEASQVRRELSSAAMDRRMLCLEDRRRHLSAWVDVLARGDTSSRVLAERGTAVLPSVASCLDDTALLRGGDAPLPDEVADRLAKAAASLVAGDAPQSHELATAALAEAVASPDGIAIARARLAVGLADEALGLASEAHASLRLAYEGARAHGSAAVATEAAIALARVSTALSRLDEGPWWARLADIEAQPITDPAQTLRRHLAAAQALHGAGRIADAAQRADAVHELLATSRDIDARTTASARLQLARLWLEGGDAARGAALAESTATELAALLGPDHPANAEARRALADAARLRGDMTRALAEARAALALAELAVGRHHVALAPYLERVATGLADTGNRADAEVVLDRLVALHEPRALDRAALASAWGTRGKVLAAANPRGSLAAFERAYELAREVFGERHRTTVRYRTAVGRALAESDRLTEAEAILSASLLVGGEVLGSDHPEVRAIHRALAITYDALGRYEEGLAHHQREAEMTVAALGEDSYAAAIGFINVCADLIRVERFEDALASCDRAAPILAAEVGGSVDVRADLHNNRGGALGELGRFEEARRELELALAAWREAAGPRSHTVSMVLLNLGLVTERLSPERGGGCEHARTYFAEALDIRLALHGPGHPSLVGPRQGLDRCAVSRR